MASIAARIAAWRSGCKDAQARVRQDVGRELIGVEPGAYPRELIRVRDRGAPVEQGDQGVEDRAGAVGGAIGHRIERVVGGCPREQGGEPDPQRVARSEFGDGAQIGRQAVAMRQDEVA